MVYCSYHQKAAADTTCERCLKPICKDTGRTVRRGREIWNLGVLFVFSFSLTLLYLDMRVVMDMGGYVSLGGPCLVTYQAPEWMRISPLFMFLVVASMGFGFTILKRKWIVLR